MRPRREHHGRSLIARSAHTIMATRKYRKRRKKSSAADAAMTVTLQPGEVPSDEQLEAEAGKRLLRQTGLLPLHIMKCR